MAVYDIDGNRIDEGGVQPEYPNYLVTETNTVLASLPSDCLDKTYLFTVITDSHNERNDIARQAWSDAVAAMGYIQAHYKSDALIHLGDIIHGVLPVSEAKARIAESVNSMLAINPKVYLCRGNHESDFAYDDPNHYELISTDEVYALAERQHEEFVVRPSNKLYYYVDYGDNLRCVFLDSDMLAYSSGQTTADLRETADGVRYGYDAEQIAWFQNTALDTSRQVVVFSHMPASRTNMTQPTIWTDDNRNSFDNIKAVAKAFVDNGGVLVGWFYGHIHNSKKTSSAGFTELGLRNSFYTSLTTDGVHSIPNFSLIAIKPDKRKVDVVAFGQDSNDSFTY